MKNKNEIIKGTKTGRSWKKKKKNRIEESKTNRRVEQSARTDIEREAHIPNVRENGCLFIDD